MTAYPRYTMPFFCMPSLTNGTKQETDKLSLLIIHVIHRAKSSNLRCVSYFRKQGKGNSRQSRHHHDKKSGSGLDVQDR